MFKFKKCYYIIYIIYKFIEYIKHYEDLIIKRHWQIRIKKVKIKIL